MKRLPLVPQNPSLVHFKILYFRNTSPIFQIVLGNSAADTNKTKLAQQRARYLPRMKGPDIKTLRITGIHRPADCSPRSQMDHMKQIFRNSCKNTRPEWRLELSPDHDGVSSSLSFPFRQYLCCYLYETTLL
jgi:hypothetical protein